LSISGGNSGVRSPVSTPPAATIGKPLRNVSVEAIASVNAFTPFFTACPSSSTVKAGIEVSAHRPNRLQIKAAPTRRLTRQ
jgi:hypothetical protein